MIENTSAISETVMFDGFFSFVFFISSPFFLFYSHKSHFVTLLVKKTIIYMENKFKNGLKDVVNFLSKFIP